MKIEFFRQIFETLWNTKFHENPPRGSRTVSCEQTDGQKDRRIDRHDEANSHILQFYEYANNITKSWHFEWGGVQ
jgi:hypothetical protein